MWYLETLLKSIKSAVLFIFYLLKKIFIIIIISFGLLFSGIACIAIWSYYNAGEIYRFVEKHYLPKDLSIVWQQPHFQIKHIKNLNFFLEFRSAQIGIKKEIPRLNVQLNDFLLTASLKPWERKIIFHQVRLVSENPVIIKIPKESKQESNQIDEKTLQKDWSDSLMVVQKYIASIEKLSAFITLENMIIDVKTANFSFSDHEIDQSLKIQYINNTIIHYESRSLSQKKQNLSFYLKGNIDLEKYRKENENFIDNSLQLKIFDFQIKQNLTGFHQENNFHLNLKNQWNYHFSENSSNKLHAKSVENKDKTIHGDSRSTVIINNEMAEGKILSFVTGLPKPFDPKNKILFQFSIPLNQEKKTDFLHARFSLRTIIDLLFLEKKFIQSLEKSCSCRLPLSLTLNTKGDFRIKDFLDKNPTNKNIAHLDIDLESINNTILDFSTKASFDFEKKEQTFHISPYLDLSLKIKNFNQLSPLLNAYGLLVPAPFDVLNGEVFLEAKGPVHLDTSYYQVPLSSRINLHSTKQKIKIDTLGTIHLLENFKEAIAKVNVKIDDFQIELPPLDLSGGKPRINNDPRIKNKASSQDIDSDPHSDALSSVFRFYLDLQLETTKSASIQLSHQFFKPYIGSNLKLKTENGKENSGYIRLTPFDFVYLRRKIHLEKMELLIKDDQGADYNFYVNGRFSIQQTMYKIFIDFTGTSDQPIIALSSDPYLTNADIISVLIYDRTRDQLISADAETAGSIEAAVADRAIGLFGLWAFSSTPIKSFHYNPISKVYTANLTLGKDLTLGIGSDWEASKQLELRKRISKKWILTGRWLSPTSTSNEKSELVLQWEKRF